jgi:two-component system, cell cycle sensor histidine kinase and response regulator CckA
VSAKCAELTAISGGFGIPPREASNLILTGGALPAIQPVMSAHTPDIIEPRRPTDAARLQVAKLRIDSHVRLADIFANVTELAADTIEVERVGVWLLVDEARVLRCADLFERSKGLHSSGTTLHVDDFPEYFDSLSRRKTVAAEVVKTDPRTSGLVESYLDPLGITSILDAAIFVGGEVVGVICHEHIGPEREWTTEARDFASSMADLLALKIRAAEVDDLRTMLKMQSSQLAEAQRLRSLAQMAAGTAHDFNNVLTVVSNYAELISLDAGASPESVDSALRIVEAAERGARLVEELMSFAKPSRHTVRVIRPADFLRENLGYFQTSVGSRHTIRTDIRSERARIFASPDQLHRAVANLTINARDAMPEGGEITIALDVVPFSENEGPTTMHAMISVSDTGIGIPSDLLERIFDPFFTTKSADKGTGLGLAIVEQTVRQTGGTVRVESTLGAGTTFLLYIPLASN